MPASSVHIMLHFLLIKMIYCSWCIIKCRYHICLDICNLRRCFFHAANHIFQIGKFENEVTQLAEPTEQEIRQMREEIEEAKKEKSRAYHRQYSREYRARNLEKQREYDRMKAREYRARRKAQAAAAQWKCQEMCSREIPKI